ncbi:hypothetical protein OG225_42660 (plasmid) [Nocardia sp. NBC_01377]|uniref:hypothetical protein n=1 Tax=Nocardia sp. NBC_01377 TaxID=2903595 RepID=UPI002F90E2C0
MRLKRWLDRDGSTQEVPADDDTHERPISLARMSIPAQVQRFVDLAEDLTRQINGTAAGLRQQVALLGDDEARQAEIESVQLDARREVEAAETTRLAADGRAREATRRAEQAERDRAEAEEAAEESIERAEAAERTAAEQAERDRQAVADARSAAADDIARIRQDAADEIANAQRDAEARIVTATQEAQQRADEEVRAISDDAATRIVAAETKAEAAEIATRAAGEKERAARADAEQARREAARDAATAAATQDANRALTQERDQLLRRIEVDTESHRQDILAANGRAEKAEDRLDEERNRHQTELDRLAAERSAADTRATTQLEAVVATHESQVAALEARIRLLEQIAASGKGEPFAPNT